MLKKYNSETIQVLALKQKILQEENHLEQDTNVIKRKIELKQDIGHARCGQVLMQSAPGKGTKVICMMPVDASTNQPAGDPDDAFKDAA